MIGFVIIAVDRFYQEPPTRNIWAWATPPRRRCLCGLCEQYYAMLDTATAAGLRMGPR
jgi:hypothetical protein